MSLSLLAVLAALTIGARAQAPSGTDLHYFTDAVTGISKEVDWVLEIVVSHERKPSRGFRRLPFQPEANVDAEPTVDCQRLQPVPRAQPRKKTQLEGFEVCGVRLLRWVRDRADRIELAVTSEKIAGGKRWLQVLLDPSINRRAWLQYAPGHKGEPVMRLLRLADWATHSRRATIPAHAARHLTLRAGPSDGDEAVRQQLPQDGQDLTVDILGVQGPWVRLAVDGCERSRDNGEGEEGNCPAGWAIWRDFDGKPLLFP